MKENLDDSNYDPFNVEGKAQYTPDDTMSLVETGSIH